ncbi:DUF5701 family protein [Cumulibacter soli]|uniref:DUF5701 family protein n=1 Tax=Cumulibacter soli TaxID=2546344 RepID=UPI001FBB0D8C|nr:DUF5701 family protein [Cumulibacter soli]
MSDAKVSDGAGTPEVKLDDCVPGLPLLTAQAELLIATGVLNDDGGMLTIEELRHAAAELEQRAAAGALLVVAEHVLPVRTLIPHVRRTSGGQERNGFIVVDMQDVDDFLPTAEAAVPSTLVYAIEDPRRGDGMRNWSPAEAQEALTRDARTPFTIGEGVHWALQAPEVIDRNACYMMIGSRRPKSNGFDSRTPALWISNGTGRDGRDRKGAPKLGWCWWNNRHTWLGFASGSRRVG